ncbi:MAG: hypothetical protein R3A46_18390 [Thermomicrobiales bacterium]
MSTSRQASGRKAARREAAQRRATRRRNQRYAIGAGIVVAIAVIGGLGAWWLVSGDGEDAAGQAIYSFDTTDYHSLAFDPQDSETLYFGHHGGLKVSEDGGYSWRDGKLTGVDVMQQSVPADGSERHFAAGHEVFSVSADGGETWSTPPNNLPALDIHGFAAAPTDGDRLYAFEIVSRSLYTSADGGVNWESLALPPGMQAGLLPMAVGYDDPLRVFAGVGDQLIESKDGGSTWEVIAAPGGAVVSVATSPDDPETLLVGTADGLWQRNPGGGWGRLGLETDGVVLAVAVHPANPSIIAALDQQGNLYRSNDAGATWGEG